MAVILIVRTALEDRTLQRELPGYRGIHSRHPLAPATRNLVSRSRPPQSAAPPSIIPIAPAARLGYELPATGCRYGCA